MTSPSPDDLLKPEYKSNFLELIDSIYYEKCCLFIGAGLSNPAGYPKWHELIEDLQVEAEKILGKPIPKISEDLDERAQQLRGLITEDQFFNMLLNEFDPRHNKQPWTAIHFYLSQLPFITFLTTNYDHILEEAFDSIKKPCRIRRYPDLFFRDSNPNTIFHIHGDLNSDDKARTIDSIILFTSDFDEAYDPDSYLIQFISEIFKEYSILFIGFNIWERRFWSLIKRLSSAHDRAQQINTKRQACSIRKIKHYAFLEYPHLKTEPLLGVNEHPYEKEKQLLNEQDIELINNKVFPIRYTGVEPHYTDLIYLVKEIFNQIEERRNRQDY